MQWYGWHAGEFVQAHTIIYLLCKAMEAGNRSLKINMPVGTDQDLPINVVMSKRAGDPSSGPEDTALAALVNPRKTRTDVAPAGSNVLPTPTSGPPPATRRPLPQVTEIREEEDWGEDGDDGDDEGFEDYGEEQSVDDDMIHNAERIKSDKMDVLNKLYRLGQKGVDVPAHLSMKSSLEELHTEFGK